MPNSDDLIHGRINAIERRLERMESNAAPTFPVYEMGPPTTPTIPPPVTFIIEDEGTPLPARNTLNFIGSSVTATDNAGNSRTDVTISSPSKAYGYAAGGLASSVTHQQALLLNAGGALYNVYNNVVKHSSNAYLTVNLAGVYLVDARAEVGVVGSWPAELRVGIYLVDDPTSVSATIYDIATRQFPTAVSGAALGYETVNLSQILSLSAGAKLGLQAANIQGSGWGSGAAGSPNAQIGAYSLTLQKVD